MHASLHASQDDAIKNCGSHGTDLKIILIVKTSFLSCLCIHLYQKLGMICAI